MPQRLDVAGNNNRRDIVKPYASMFEPAAFQQTNCFFGSSSRILLREIVRQGSGQENRHDAHTSALLCQIAMAQ